MRLFSLALAGVLLVPVAAKADTLNFNVSGSLGGFTGSGVFTGTGNGDGSYTITAVSGPLLLGPLSVLAPNSFTFNDNLFFPTASSLLDLRGLAFAGAFGRADLFSIGPLYFVRALDVDGSPFIAPIRFSLDSTTAITPEPSSVLLCMTGMLAVGGVMLRNRFRPAFTRQVSWS